MVHAEIHGADYYWLGQITCCGASICFTALLQPKWDAAGAIDILSFSYATRSVSTDCKVQEVNGKHLLKAEPLNAILDPQYFVRQVHECIVKVLSDRMAKEQQAADQAAPFRWFTLHIPISLKQSLQLIHYNSNVVVAVKSLPAKPNTYFRSANLASVLSIHTIFSNADFWPICIFALKVASM